MSFPFNANIETVKSLKFHDDLNILIGPNGSGKSNALSIISEIFKKGLFRDATVLPDRAKLARMGENKTLRKEVQASKQPKKHILKPNRFTNQNSIEIKMNLQITDSDKSNLKLLFKNRNALQAILRDCYQIATDWNSITEQGIDSHSGEFSIIFRDANGNEFLSADNLSEPYNQFIYEYLLWFEFIQFSIEIANQDEPSRNWPSLKPPFVMLGSSRDFNSIPDVIELDDRDGSKFKNIRNEILQTSIHSLNSGKAVGVNYALWDLVKTYHDIRNKTSSENRDNISNKSPLELLAEKSYFGKLNEYLKKFLNLTLALDEPHAYTLDYPFFFVGEQENRIPLEQLSSGEKGIIYLIFSIFGFNIKNGVMIIDEPEIHIHPQMQQKLVDIVKSAIADFDIQFIVATHSPVFVNPQTITGVQRFLKKNNLTQAISASITETEKELVQILDYSNSSKIFFVDNVILVEGQSDEYFYKKFLKNIKSNPENFEILDIKGKMNFSLWQHFLKKFGLNVFFIGDQDNIFDDGINIVNSVEKQRWENQYDSSSEGSQKISADDEYKGTREYRNDLIQFVKSNLNSEWQNIESRFETKYSEGIFILKEGELEDYVNISGRRRKMEKIINFCNNDFSTWFQNKTNPKLIELENFFSKIS